MATKRVKVSVLYKSGNRQEIECDAFTIRKDGSRLVEVEWEKAIPRPLLFGVDNVEAVWVVEP